MNFLRTMAHSIFGSRLRNKTTLLLIVAAAVPLLLLGTVVLTTVDENHAQDVAKLEEQLLAQKESEIRKFFADTIGIIELRVTYSQAKPIDAGQQETLLAGLLANNGAFEQVTFIDLDGKESSSMDREGDELLLLDRSKLPYFETLEAGKEYISPVYQTLSGPMVTIAAPVYNKNGTTIQYLAADVHLSSIANSIKAATLGSRGYVVLTDGSLRVIGSGAGIEPGESMKGSPLFSTERRAEASAHVHYYMSTVAKTPVVGLVERIPEFDWYVLIEWPLDDANSVSADVRAQILLFTLVSLIAAMLLAPLVARRLTRPIEILKEGAARIAQGELTHTVSIHSGDELEELGKSFNVMGKGLQELEELQKEFVHIITHELRAPVTAIRGYVSLIKEGDAGLLPPQLTQYVDVIWQSAEHLSALINDLLDAARIESGKFSLDLKQEDLSKIVREIISEMTPLAKTRGMTITYTEAKLPQVNADAMRTKQVLVNLVSNAIKYGADNGTVSISHSVLNDEVTTSVANPGAGISAEQQTHIFEKFFRAGGSKAIGTGLGLYITKQLVEKMGGSIGFRSEPDKETVFNFSLKSVG